jgi:predicted nucleotidyltransferase
MDRLALVELLRELSEELSRRRVSARVYIVGGAAIALAYDAERSTRDIDGVILDHPSAVVDAVKAVGRRHGLPGSWLDEQASSYVPAAHDTDQRVVFDHPNLRVMAASPHRLLAMKVRAARSTDVDDIRLLCELVGVASFDEVISIVTTLFPSEPVSERSRKVLGDILCG